MLQAASTPLSLHLFTPLYLCLPRTLSLLGLIAFLFPRTAIAVSPIIPLFLFRPYPCILSLDFYCSLSRLPIVLSLYKAPCTSIAFLSLTSAEQYTSCTWLIQSGGSIAFGLRNLLKLVALELESFVLPCITLCILWL